MAVALHFTALVGASSIQLTFWTNGQSEQRSKAPANIAGLAATRTTMAGRAENRHRARSGCRDE